MEQLQRNKEGYHFYTRLFPAIMQGNQAEQSIVDALEKIYPYEDFFDLVVIIRGGGSQVDLSCFDNYNVAYHVTQFPLPVLTGIGHEKDDSIVDLVAHTRLKTPTAVAEFILHGVSAFEEQINLLEHRGIELTEERLEDEQSLLEELTREFSVVVRNLLMRKNNELMQKSWKFRQEVKLTLQRTDHRLGKKMQKMDFLVDHYFYTRHQKVARAQNMLDIAIPREIVRRKLKLNGYLEKLLLVTNKQLDREKHKIELAGQMAVLTDPGNLLKKGYTITTINGKVVKDLSLLKKEELLKTLFFEGSVLSKITEIKYPDHDDN